MSEKLSSQKQEKLRELISNHNDLCDNFSKEIHELMDEIYQICEPAGIIASRINTYKHGQEVTRIHLMPKTSVDVDIDEDWLKSLWAEDDRL